MKEQRKHFERLSNELDTALVKNAEAPKLKPLVCDEMEKNVMGIRKSFGHVSLDYICQINKFYFTRSLSILDMIQQFSQSILSFYQFGSVLVQNQSRDIVEITVSLEKMSQSSKKQIGEMEYSYDFIRSNVSSLYFLVFLFLEL